MRLYISCDMEGVAGVCAWEQVDARTPHPDYEIYRRFYTQEIVAAVEGARSAGATEIIINDSHGPMRNLILDLLPADVRIVSGARKPFSMAQGGHRCDGAFFVGYHGAIGDMDAVLCHTYTPSVIYELTINGVRCSEATINAALLGHFGVPVLMVTGDRTTVDGVRATMPWVHGVTVKESIGNLSADSISPAASQRAIREGAAIAITARNAAKAFTFNSPITMDVALMRVEQADYVAQIPGFERTGSRSVRFVDDDMPTLFKAFVATFRLGALA
jgi:D-amino peptidase